MGACGLRSELEEARNPSSIFINQARMSCEKPRCAAGTPFSPEKFEQSGHEQGLAESKKNSGYYIAWPVSAQVDPRITNCGREKEIEPSPTEKQSANRSDDDVVRYMPGWKGWTRLCEIGLIGIPNGGLYGEREEFRLCSLHLNHSDSLNLLRATAANGVLQSRNEELIGNEQSYQKAKNKSAAARQGSTRRRASHNTPAQNTRTRNSPA